MTGNPLRPHRCARPLPTRDVRSIFAPRNRWTLPQAYSVPARDPALGGKIGIVIMALLAAFVGALLACGGVPW